MGITCATCVEKYEAWQGAVNKSYVQRPGRPRKDGGPQRLEHNAWHEFRQHVERAHVWRGPMGEKAVRA